MGNNKVTFQRFIDALPSAPEQGTGTTTRNYINSMAFLQDFLPVRTDADRYEITLVTPEDPKNGQQSHPFWVNGELMQYKRVNRWVTDLNGATQMIATHLSLGPTPYLGTEKSEIRDYLKSLPVQQTRTYFPMEG